MTGEPFGLPEKALLEHAGFVRSLVRSLVREEHEVDDLVQDTWVVALESPPRR